MRDVGSGDKLARGAIRATYLVSENTLTEERWKEIFGPPEPVRKAWYEVTCPVHGKVIDTDRECFLSGGYPLYDETLVVKCPAADCDEKAPVSGYVEIE